VLREDSCGADQRRGVQVMPAGMHSAIARGEVDLDLFVDRQRVHVAAQQHGGGVWLRAPAATQHGSHRRRGFA
jgi:hypothetical protein